MLEANALSTRLGRKVDEMCRALEEVAAARSDRDLIPLSEVAAHLGMNEGDVRAMHFMASACFAFGWRGIRRTRLPLSRPRATPRRAEQQLLVWASTFASSAATSHLNSARSMVGVGRRRSVRVETRAASCLVARSMAASLSHLA